MNITIIGSGNTATVLGRALQRRDHVIKEITGRNNDAVKELAQKLNANVCTQFAQLSKESDVYIIAVRDDAIEKVSSQLQLGDKIIVHTAGSVSINVLKKATDNYGVLYPLQSLRKEISYLPGISFLMDANNDKTREIIYQLATSVSTSVKIADDKMRLQYHLSAVVTSNFINHLFALSKDYCDKNKIDFNLLLPLVEETVNRLHFYEPSLMQTGPAIRGDQSTMKMHLQMLNDFPELKKIYEVMSESITQFQH